MRLVNANGEVIEITDRTLGSRYIRLESGDDGQEGWSLGIELNPEGAKAVASALSPDADALAKIRRLLVGQRGAGNLATLQSIQEVVWPSGPTDPEEVMRHRQREPMLGLASTRELLQELKVRGEVPETEWSDASKRLAKDVSEAMDKALEVLPSVVLDYRTVG